MSYRLLTRLAVTAALLVIPALAFGQPVITSVAQNPTPSNTGAVIDVFGTGFGLFTDYVTFPGGQTSSPGIFGIWGPGHIQVYVPACWSGPITLTSGASGLTSGPFAHTITFAWSTDYWPGGSMPFTWFLNNAAAPGNTFNDTRDALITGYNAWSCASGMTQSFGGGTAIATTASDGVNCRYWSNSGWSPSTIAVTTWFYFISSHQIFEADIGFNAQHYTWATNGVGTSMDIGNIGTHEEGHTIGFLDLYGTDDALKTMYGYGANGETQKRALALEDVQGAEYVYPHAGRPNFTAGTPGGWFSPLVPRNTADATGAFAPLPFTLTGNTTTYLNAAMTNNGLSCAAPWGTNNLYVDDVGSWSPNWGGVWSAGLTLGWTNLGSYVQGGRHTLAQYVDAFNETIESNEFDNLYQTQFVWSPYLLTDQVAIYDYAPPSVGPFFNPNCNGYQATGNFWGCVGIIPTTPGDDYDLNLYDDYANSTTGFANVVASSAYGGTNSDFVLFNGNRTGYGATRWAGTIRFATGGGAGYVDMQQSDAVNGATMVPTAVYNSYVSSGTITMGAYDVVKVHEVYLGSVGTAYTFSMLNQSGTADLNISLFDQAGTYFGKPNAIVSSQTFGAGTNESFNYTPAVTGYYAVVVWKRGSADVGLSNTYELRVGAALSNLNATVTPAGFSWPAVPRNDATAGYFNAPVSATLDGNVNDTFFNWATQQEGPNPMPGWDSYLVIDENDYPYSWFFTTGAGNGPGSYQVVNAGPNVLRGGRHSLTALPNLFSGVAESNLADNVWRGQWVWSPLVTTKGVPNVRSVPPNPNFTYFFYPNSDGLSYTHNSIYAWVVSEAAQNTGDDNDLYVYDDYSGSTSGFSNLRGYSLYGGTATDFVTGQYQGSPNPVYPATFRYVGGVGGNFTSDQSDAVGRSPGATGNFTGQVMAANRLTDVYEADFLPNTTYYISLRRNAGTSDIAFEVFPGAAGGVYGRGTGAGSNVLDPDTDILTFTSAPSGTFYPLVVYRTSGLGSGAPLTYELHWTTVGYLDAPGNGNTPATLAFAGAMPNPAMGNAQLSFDLPGADHVRLQLFDINGRLVRSLVDETMGPGHHAVVWDGRDMNGIAVRTGLYWARFSAANRVISRRVTLLR